MYTEINKHFGLELASFVTVMPLFVNHLTDLAINRLDLDYQ